MVVLVVVIVVVAVVETVVVTGTVVVVVEGGELVVVVATVVEVAVVGVVAVVVVDGLLAGVTTTWNPMKPAAIVSGPPKTTTQSVAPRGTDEVDAAGRDFGPVCRAGSRLSIFVRAVGCAGRGCSCDTISPAAPATMASVPSPARRARRRRLCRRRRPPIVTATS